MNPFLPRALPRFLRRAGRAGAALVLSSLAAPAQSVEMVLDLSGLGGFYDLPFPTDLRQGSQGELDLGGFPNPQGLPLVELMRTVAEEDVLGFGRAAPLAIRFTGPLWRAELPRFPGAYLDHTAPIQLVDVDPSSPERGRRFPLLVDFLEGGDSYRPTNLLQVLPVQGFSLRENTVYALVVLDSAPVPPGWTLLPLYELQALLNGVNPGGTLGAAALQVYAPLAEQLIRDGVDPMRVAAATVFTTGQPTEVLFRIGEALNAWPAPAPLGPLVVSHDFPKYYVLESTWRVPMFQNGLAPYLVPTSGGVYQFDPFGAPLVQDYRTAKFVVTVPKGDMPAAGFPLLFYIHGTGGEHTQVYDRGEYNAAGTQDEDGGPAEIAAERGWGACGMAGHLAPQHVGSASFGGYVLYNVLNPRAMRDNFLQLVSEHLLFRRLVSALVIDPTLCPETNATASPDGKIRFQTHMQVVMGQSLGSYVSGMLAAADPADFRGLVLTGAGGSWIEFARGPKDPFDLQAILEQLIFQLPAGEKLDLWHPLFDLVEMVLGPSNNLHYLETLLRKPRPGRFGPHVLTIQGYYDPQVPDNLQRAQGIALGMDFVGPEVGPYPEGQILPFLLLAGAHQLQPPVASNLLAPGVGFRTAAVVRYLEDGIGDGHAVTFQREEPKHQYGCFLELLAATGTPVILQGLTQGSPCR